jgi:hypothetical protein
LYEIARIGELLSNANNYKDGDDSRLIKTQDLSKWLRLAAELESVEIDSWKFASRDGVWCSPVAEMYTSDSKHFSSYSTHLTRFIYIYNSLDELYKFLDKHYINIPKKLRSHSKKCSYLLDNSKDLRIPKYFWHLSENYQSFVKQYIALFGFTIKVDIEYNHKVSFALELIRCIRNHIAHGVFPIVGNPEYHGAEHNEMKLIIELLGHSCRLAVLYIQIIFINFNNGFNGGYDLFIDTLDEAAVSTFLNDYLLKLHLESDFGLNYDDFYTWESLQLDKNN